MSHDVCMTQVCSLSFSLLSLSLKNAGALKLHACSLSLAGVPITFLLEIYRHNFHLYHKVVSLAHQTSQDNHHLRHSPLLSKKL